MDFLPDLYSNIQKWFSAVTESKNWIAWSTVLSIGMLFFFNTPKINYLYAYSTHQVDHPPFKRIEEQIRSPLTARQYPPASHEAKMALRLTVPLIAKVLHLIPVWKLYVLQVILGVIGIVLHLKLLYEITNDRLVSLLATIAFTTSYTGASAFIDVYGLYDSFVYVAFLAIMYYRKYWLTFLLLFLSFFTDERAIFASFLVMVWVYLTVEKKRFPIFSAVYLSSLILYVIARFYLQNAYGLSTANNGTMGVFAMVQNFNNIGLGVFGSFEASWIILILACVAIWMEKRIWFLLFYLGGLGMVILIALNVWDVTRSIGYGYPAIIIAVYLLYPHMKKASGTLLMSGVAVMNLLIPVYAVQLNIYWINPFLLNIIKLLK
jgi:hypothetical protein